MPSVWAGGGSAGRLVALHEPDEAASPASDCQRRPATGHAASATRTPLGPIMASRRSQRRTALWAVAKPIAAAPRGRHGSASHSGAGNVSSASRSVSPAPLGSAAKPVSARTGRPCGPASAGSAVPRTHRRQPRPPPARLPVRRSGRRYSGRSRPGRARSRSPRRRVESPARVATAMTAAATPATSSSASPAQACRLRASTASRLIQTPWSSTSVPGAASSRRRESGSSSTAASVRRTAITAGMGIASRSAPCPSHGFSRSASS